MLTAAGQLDLPGAELAAIFALDRAFTLHAVERRATVYDTLFVPGQKGDVADAQCIYILLDGSFDWRDGPSFTGPCAFVASMTAFEGQHGRRDATYRAGGELFRAVDLRVRTPMMRPRTTSAPEPIEISAAVYDAARSYAALARAPHEARERVPIVKALLLGLREDGILVQDIEPSRSFGKVFEHLWGVLGPTLEKLAFATTRDELTQRSLLSTKRLQSELGRLAMAAQFPWLGWRDLTLRFRLRVAVLFLSNPAIPIGDIAKRVGYSGTVALAHAFHGEGLPAPGDVRAAILAAGS